MGACSDFASAGELAFVLAGSGSVEAGPPLLIELYANTRAFMTGAAARLDAGIALKQKDFNVKFETMKQMGIALNEQQTVNIAVIKCLIETAKLLPADETRLPLTDALQRATTLLDTHSAVLGTLSNFLEAEARGAD